jgi:phage terminase small subunit
MALTAQQQAFAEEYLRTFNKTDSYLAAYPSAKRSTAASNGHRLLKENAEVAEYVQLRISETAMSADEVLMRLAEHARGAHSAYIREDGTIDIEGMVKKGKAHLIKKISYTKGRKEYEFHDAQTALIQLGKHHKLFVDRQEVTGKDGGPIEHDYRGELLKKLADLAGKSGRTVASEDGSESTAGGADADPELASAD